MPLALLLVSLTVTAWPVVAGPTSAPSVPIGPGGAVAASSASTHAKVVLADHPPAWAPTRAPVGDARALTGPVDPFAYHSSEPAPMGVTDYGIDSQGNAYIYTTPVWQADVNISRLLAYYPTNATGNGYVGFQLNVVVKVQAPAPSTAVYYFWIQDVASLDTQTNSLGFVDNIWNLSSTSMDSNSISGNGSVYQYPSSGLYWYADGPGCNYAGNCVTLHYPADFAVRVTTGLVNNVPHVAFMFDSTGHGWTTYDNASFPFARGFVDDGFVVDGTNYLPIGIYADAEWDYTGPSGSTQVDQNTSMEMRLQYWNGHNMESPPNAFNFGSNTGEMISNVRSSYGLNSGNGSLGAKVTTGPGSLGALYYRTQVSVLNVSSPQSSNGTLWVNGSPYPFRGGETLLTLQPGTYHLVLTNSSETIDSANVTLAAGGYTRLTMTVPVPWPVTFSENGLPSGTPWGVTVAGHAQTPVGRTVSLELFNGSYPYTVTPVPGYVIPGYTGWVNLSGTPVTVYLNFTPFTYTLTFRETGLASGSPWWVQVGLANQTSTTSALSFIEPNGSYSYSTGAGQTYLPDAPSGSATVSAKDATEYVTFGPAPGYLVGDVTPSSAGVTVDGIPVDIFDGSFNVTLAPGTYTVYASATGYNATVTTATIAAGGLTSIHLTLHLTPQGHPGGNQTNNTTKGTTTSTGGLTTMEVGVLVGGAVVVAAVVVAVAAAMRGRRMR